MATRLFLSANGMFKRQWSDYRRVLADLQRAFDPLPAPPSKQQRHRIDHHQFVQTGEGASHG